METKVFQKKPIIGQTGRHDAHEQGPDRSGDRTPPGQTIRELSDFSSDVLGPFSLNTIALASLYIHHAAV